MKLPNNISRERHLSSYEEFWPFYVSQHQNSNCRRLHFAGTSIVLLLVLAAIRVSLWFGLAMPVVGYSLAWLGHFVFEGNRPATFGHPFWSLRADFRMYRYILTGRMAKELRKVNL
jgi:hypothetical protein